MDVVGVGVGQGNCPRDSCCSYKWYQSFQNKYSGMATIYQRLLWEQEMQHVPTSKSISSYLRLSMRALGEKKKIRDEIINQLTKGLGLLMDELLLVLQDGAS